MTSSTASGTPGRGAVATVDRVPAGVALRGVECLSLLGHGGHGRVAASIGAVPVIIPVSFALVGGDVVFSPGPGDRLSRAVAGCVVAFETDSVGAEGQAVWGVHVTGVARPLPAQPGAPAFGLPTEIISGWRIARPDL